MKFQGFAQDSFDLLKELKSNNNSEWITANWARYEDLKSRIRALVQDVAETYISLEYPDLETRADSTHCLSRINRRQASREGELYHKYLWAAFYRKCRGNKTKDFQLYITIHGNFFETGLYFGYYTSDFFKNTFREKVRREKDSFLGLARALPVEFKFPVARNVSTHDNPPEGLRVENEAALDQWLKSSNLEIVKVYDANDPVVRSSRLVEAVIEDFKTLDPIYRFILVACENVQEEDELRAREEEKLQKKTLKARPSEISIRTEEINIPSFLESVNLESSSYLISPKYVRDPEFIKIALIIENCSSTNWVLPSFQRYFDWKKEDIRSFLESVFNGYYVGSFLLWDAKGEPELGVQTIKGVAKEEKEWKKDLVILDGQQRITSLYYAVCAPNGHHFEDESRWRDTKIFKEHPLYFYIDFGSFLKDPNSLEIIKISNKKISNEECFKSILFPLYELEEHGHWLAEFSKFLRSQSQNIEKIDEIREAIRKKLYYVWAEYEIPYISLPKSMGINQVTEIFEQLNTKGKPLNVFDLLVARLFKYNIKLKDLWDETCKVYSKTIFRYSKAIEKIPIYVLQSISLCYHESSSAKRSDILDIYKNIYTKKSEYRFEDHWIEFSKYLDRALEKLENLRDGFGVKDEKEVPFESMIPVLAALLRTIDNQENKASCYKKLDKWYWSAVFTNAYSQAAESQMTTDFKEVRDWFEDDAKTPKAVTNMLNDLPKLNLLPIQSNWNSKYRGTMSLVALEGAKDFETDQALENARENDKDHLFPKSVFGSHTNINSVLNMTWMSDSTNRYIKNYKKPSAYIPELVAKKYAGDKERFNRILKTHLISEDALTHLLNDVLDQFLLEREKTVITKLKEHLGIEGLETTSTLISPQTPYTNKKIFWDTLRSCQGYIQWIDKYFTKPGLELISQSALDPGKIREIKILMSADKVDEDFRRLFKDLRDELKNRGIICEVRAITDAKTKSAIHDRWILSENRNFNVTSPDIMARGQYSEILETPNKPPFDEWWNNSKDIIQGWDEIKKSS